MEAGAPGPSVVTDGLAARQPPRELELLAAAWLLIFAGWSAVPWLGLGNAALLSFAVGAWLVWAVPLAGSRRACLGSCSAGEGRGAPLARGSLLRGAFVVLLGVAAGYALFVPWLLATWHAGRALGLSLASLGTPFPPLAGEPSLWITGIVLAPLFEERLYRGHLLAALRPRLGAAAALAVTSALFAAPHLAPWNVLGTFLSGLALGALALASGGLALPLGVHAGLNLAALAGGVPPVQLTPSPDVGLAVGTMCLAAAGVWLRRRGDGACAASMRPLLRASRAECWAPTASLPTSPHLQDRVEGCSSTTRTARAGRSGSSRRA
jgi:membrane protease YdiL (CAAX protease family)